MEIISDLPSWRYQLEARSGREALGVLFLVYPSHVQ